MQKKKKNARNKNIVGENLVWEKIAWSGVSWQAHIYSCMFRGHIMLLVRRKYNGFQTAEHLENREQM